MILSLYIPRILPLALAATTATAALAVSIVGAVRWQHAHWVLAGYSVSVAFVVGTAATLVAASAIRREHEGAIKRERADLVQWVESYPPGFDQPYENAVQDTLRRARLTRSLLMDRGAVPEAAKLTEAISLLERDPTRLRTARAGLELAQAVTSPEFIRVNLCEEVRLDSKTELVVAADVASRLGVSRARVSVLSKRSDFPTPIGRLGRSDVWRASSAGLERVVA
jgi:hypothetical protein